MKHIEELKNLFESVFNEKVECIDNIKADGSSRLIYRISSKKRSLVGVYGPDKKENKAFVEFSRYFLSKGLSVPKIYAYDDKKQIYIESDLGNQTLFDYLKEKRKNGFFSSDIIENYKKALNWLSKFQTKTIKGLNLDWCYPRKEFDEQSMMWDLNYFKYYFLKLGGISFDEQKLEDDYKRFIEAIKTAPRDFFLYRDFQSRNIMLKDGELYFIDYQGGRKGFLAYDVASFLYDAKADIPPDIRKELLDYYLDLNVVKSVISRKDFLRYYYFFVYIRLMQAMGAYGLRGFYERKPHFLTSVPYVIKNIEWLLSSVELEIKIPELIRVFKRITTSTYLRQFSDKKLGLNLRIYSFSYKDGFPIDNQGHNGGFVFDLRCLPNPGKNQAYAELTGRDKIVADFLNNSEEVLKFYKNCYELVNQAINNYVSRNFTELYVAFGCTGGRHRSVYIAEKLYKDFVNVKNINPILKHIALEKSKI